jgi:hypothetical protein
MDMINRRVCSALYAHFDKLIDKYGFSRGSQNNDETAFWVQYVSPVFGVTIEEYHRTFTVTLHKISFPESEIDLFNLVRYLKVPFERLDYVFDISDKKELEEYYIRQFAYLSDSLIANIDKITAFFEERDFEQQFRNVRDFVIRTYPNIFGSDEGREPEC